MSSTRRATIEGTLVRFQYANYRRGRNGVTVNHLIADIIAPLPPWELWVIKDATKVDYTRNRPFFYRTKSGRKPKALEALEPDTPVSIVATIEPWKNGLGAWISRVTMRSRVDG